ncbi:MAG: helix-turn-helix domain-containing protein [Spirochaetales bacterium]|nr:helix-turn-helix domain-containing protein [Spirochaetales bacterium]
MIDFAGRLKDLRTTAGLRQKDLAEALGVAQTTIANYEQGARFPDEKNLRRLADHFDVSLDYLMGRTDVNLAARDVQYPGGYFREEQESLSPMSPMAKQYLDLLLAGKREEASRLIHEAVAGGTDVGEIYGDVFERTLQEVGLMWMQNRLDVAMEHYFSASTQLIMSQLYPHITASAREKKTTVCLVMAVCGEFHDIGARMVADFMEMDGWKTFFLGNNLCSEHIIKAAADHGPQVLALSATMFFNVEELARSVRAIRGVEALNDLVILVGGRPFNQNPNLWKQVGADGFARSPAEAVKLANSLVETPADSPRVPSH